jgi:uncharacterized repeat protein (TIGR01451 family)
VKRILWLAAIFFLLMPQMGGWSSPDSQSIYSVIPDGGFELNLADPVNGWSWPGENWVWDATSAHSGSHSARVNRGTGDETASLWSDFISINHSMIYLLSFWFRTEFASKNPSVAIYQYTSSNSQTGIRQMVYSNVFGGTNDWSQVNYRFQTTPDATQIKIRIYLYTDTSGTFWFDDFSLDQGKPAVYPFLTGFPVEASGWVYLSSPSVVDLNNDGNNELLVAVGNSINGWDKSGNILPGYPLETGDRYIYNQLSIADVDADNRMEIFAGTRTPNPPEGQCRVYGLNDDGSQLPGWPIIVDWNPKYSNNDCKVTSIALADIDGNQQLEVIASTTNNASGNPGEGIFPANIYAWHSNGLLLNGYWPSKLTSAGFYGAIAAGDLDGNGIQDIIAARDHHLLNAYSNNGIALHGWPIETYLEGNHGNYQSDLRIEYGRSAPVLADLDNNNSLEYIVIGNVTGPGNSTEILNTAVLVLNSDGTRYHGWSLPALASGVLTQEDIPQESPAIADINEDGFPEIIATTLDGWLRVYDRTKDVLWEFNYSQGSTVFASEPVIGDIDGDNDLEVIFSTHVPIAGNDYDGPVGLWSLEEDGTVTPGFPLPIPTPGVEATPTLADLDGDGNVEILVATITGQVFAWDTPYPLYPARFPWPMGRHDLQRTAEYIDPKSFGKSYVTGSPNTVKNGEITTFMIHISSRTPVAETVTLTDTIPAGITYLPGTLAATAGVATERHGVIQWSGLLPENLSVDISYQVVVKTDKPSFIVNTVLIDTTIEGILQRKGYLFANTLSTYLPVLHR